MYSYRWPQKPFADPVRPQRFTTGPVGPLGGINKTACGAKLFPMTVSAHPVDCSCFCHLLKAQHYCLCPNGKYNPILVPTHPHYLPHPPLYMVLKINRL